MEIEHEKLLPHFGTATASNASGLSQRFIVAEIERGNLKADKVDNRWLIRKEDFMKWYDSTPLRGTATTRSSGRKPAAR